MSAFLRRDGVIPNKVLRNFYQLMQIWTVVGPSCLLHERLWDLTRASVALTSQALLLSTTKQHQRREIFKTREAYETFYE